MVAETSEVFPWLCGLADVPHFWGGPTVTQLLRRARYTFLTRAIQLNVRVTHFQLFEDRFPFFFLKTSPSQGPIFRQNWADQKLRSCYFSSMSSFPCTPWLLGKKRWNGILVSVRNCGWCWKCVEPWYLMFSGFAILFDLQDESPRFFAAEFFNVWLPWHKKHVMRHVHKWNFHNVEDYETSSENMNPII